MPTWFITGCSTGFGRHLAQAVLQRGDQAIVTARDPASIQDIAAPYPDTALAIALDVTKPEQIKAAVQKAEERFGGIDVLVNNAGYGYRSAVEEGDEQQVADMFATNFFGLAAVTKAVLPGMRARRRGTIVNISSVAGRMSQPGSGYYSATKFAVAGLSDGLRKEAGHLGIKVIVIEPGGFRTDFAGRSLHQSPRPIDDYATTAGLRRKENSTIDGRQPGDPARAAQAIILAVENPNPPSRLVLGREAVARVRAEVQKQLKELDAWEAVSINADFPAEG